MAIEAKRGCGYRKIGGVYLVGEGIPIGCDRLPLPTHVCPTCNQGIHASLGFTWIDYNTLFGECPHIAKNNAGAEKDKVLCHRVGCELCMPPNVAKYGLMWVGEKFYGTPQAFTEEAQKLGVSKRLGKSVPIGLKVGNFVMLGHRKVVMSNPKDFIKQEDGTELNYRPAIFYGFHIRRIEIIITASQSKDEKFMEGIKKRNLTPVVVPDDDKDHRGTVYDKKKEEE